MDISKVIIESLVQDILVNIFPKYTKKAVTLVLQFCCILSGQNQYSSVPRDVQL